MGTVVLGWILIGTGVIAVIAGIAGGIATMFLDIKQKAAAGRSFTVGSIEDFTKLIKALTEFVKALIKAPQWLVLVIIGFTLIAWGGTMIS